MSRSFRKNPYCGITTAISEARDKKIWHSSFRSKAKKNIKSCNDYDGFIDVHYRDVSNPWDMHKDGKQRLNIFRNPKLKKYLRK